MTMNESGAGAAQGGLVGRIIRMITATREEWGRIEPEPATVPGLITGWAVPLALIPALTAIVTLGVIGSGVPGLAVVKLPLLNTVVMAGVQFALLVAMTWVMGQVINALAPNFGGTQNPVQAMKVAAYSGTAACAFSVLQIVPFLGIVAIVGLVLSVFALHAGLPVLMKSPLERTLGFTASVVGIMFVLWLVAWAVSSAVTGPLMMSHMMQRPGVSINGGPGGAQVKIGGTTIDTGAIEKAAKEMENSVTVGENGTVTINGGAATAIDVEKLKALLPPSLPGGYTRDEVSSGSGGVAGMGVANASATYRNGDKSIELSITDTSAMGALAGMAGAFGVQATTENSDGFEKTRVVDGRMTVEKLSKSSGTATYGVMIANRVMLQAEGNGTSFDDVRAAVNAVGVPRVEALAQESAAKTP